MEFFRALVPNYKSNIEGSEKMTISCSRRGCERKILTGTSAVIEERDLKVRGPWDWFCSFDCAHEFAHKVQHASEFGVKRDREDSISKQDRVLKDQNRGR